MRRLTTWTTAVFLCALAFDLPTAAERWQPKASPQIDLAERLAGGKLRAVNREVSPLQGKPGGVHVAEKAGPGVVWIEGSDFAEGTIEVDVRGRDVLQQSFLGVAFHRKDDNTYEAVYLRPFNFRATEPARHDHAVQYMTRPGLRLAAAEKRVPGRIREPGRSIGGTDRVGAAPNRRERRNRPDIRRRRHIADARGPQARNARSRRHRLVGGKQQRRRLREPPRHATEMTIFSQIATAQHGDPGTLS